jgi:nitrogenase molybdenum-iron protein alpha/beta subunit
MAVLKGKGPIIREKRLSTIAAYYGTVEAILREYYDGKLKQRVRTFSQDFNSDILNALQVINTIENVGIVIHGPRGCGIIQNHYNVENSLNANWAVTNLEEEDSILGSDRKLMNAIKTIYKKNHPKLMFVVTTAVVAINNDDVASVTQELSEELEIPVIPIYTDGFRSKVGVSGYDTAIHSIIKYLLPLKAQKREFINLIALSENKETLEELNRLITALNLETNTFPRYSNTHNIVDSANAAYNLVINQGEGDYFARILEEIYSIPSLTVNAPIGVKATDKWLTALGKQLDREKEAKELIENESAKTKKELEVYKLNHTKVFLSIAPQYANSVISHLEELNAELVGIKFPYLDITLLKQLEKFYKKNPDLSLLIGEGQPYEQVNIIKKSEAEVYIGDDSAIDSILPSNIPVFNTQNINIVGYQGSINFARELYRIVTYNGFSQNFLNDTKQNIYQSSWLKKSANWYIKQEVR